MFNICWNSKNYARFISYFLVYFKYVADTTRQDREKHKETDVSIALFGNSFFSLSFSIRVL